MKKTTKRNYEILRRHTLSGGWLSLRIENKWYVQAQVFDTPSKYGIGARDNDGNWLPGVTEEALPQSARISKLSITNDLQDWSRAPGGCVYNYDRGLDFDDTPAGLLDKAIAAVLHAAG